jgi:hypothetical protein
MSRVSLHFTPFSNRRVTWGRKDEEYVADFYLTSRRTLDGAEWKVFNYHYLLGADWKLCCRQLKMDRGNFFHTVYRIQQKLGRMFRELEPYGLFPLDVYFCGAAAHSERPAEPVRAIIPAEPRNSRPPLRPPVRQVA